MTNHDKLRIHTQFGTIQSTLNSVEKDINRTGVDPAYIDDLIRIYKHVELLINALNHAKGNK